MDVKSLFVRSVSGLILAAVLIGATIWCEVSKVIIFALIGLFAIKELLLLLNKSGKVSLYGGGSLMVAIYVLLVATYQYDALLALPVFVMLILIRLTAEIYRKPNGSLLAIGGELGALLYVLIPTLLLFDYDKSVIIFLLALVWSNDVGAYLVGVLFGKHRLFERVSPKKSWEGFWGGFIITIVVSALIGHYFFEENIVRYTIIGALISVSAVYGDLFESMIKREVEVKDSGNIIPGHGGMLDRFDALFYAVPTYYVVTYILNYF